MSEFDKEAEREKLRKQFEEEKREREATQHMSELLLKGATMTNKHCDQCGDPIFRYQDQEFCPTCQQAVTQAAVNEEAPPAADEGVATPDGQDQTHTEAPVDTDGAESAADTTTQTESEPSTGTEISDRSGPDTTSDVESTARDTSASSRTAEQSTGRSDAPVTEVPPNIGAVDGDLEEARTATVRTLTALARRAEATDDVGHARELLAATREAAEALSAIDSIRR